MGLSASGLGLSQGASVSEDEGLTFVALLFGSLGIFHPIAPLCPTPRPHNLLKL